MGGSSTTEDSSGAATPERVHAALAELAQTWAADRRARQRRRELDPADFDRLRRAGFHLFGVPRAQGGLWESAAQTTRPVAGALRTLAGGDSSVALVASMHPAVLSFWLATPRVPDEYQAVWDAQVAWVARTVLDGAWWGTITSEPGSGGDVLKTKATAHRDERRASDASGVHFLLSGDKHFGSGSGVMDYMLTTAIPAGEAAPDWFFLEIRDAPQDSSGGSAGATLTAPWDGHGMIATQSHGMRYDDFPATRAAWPGGLAGLQANAGAFIGTCFTAVITGIVDVAVDTARAQLAPRRAALRPYEKVELARAEMEAWLIDQALEGMLRAVERGTDDAAVRREVLQGKTAIAELAEAALARLCRVMGGGSFARYSPFGFWFEDVRALGFLRPPWGLAYDRLIEDAGTVPPPRIV
jgi:alkylation response protein AidB-like acyl-CoA dehydrogenase